MPDAPTLWDLQRLIERNHADTRDDIVDLKAQIAHQSQQNAAQFERYVLREVYEAREAALLRRVEGLEQQQKDSKAAVRNATYAAVASVIATVLAAVILAVILKGGKP